MAWRMLAGDDGAAAGHLVAHELGGDEVHQGSRRRSPRRRAAPRQQPRGAGSSWIATNSISGVTMPARAQASCVTAAPALARNGRRLASNCLARRRPRALPLSSAASGAGSLPRRRRRGPALQASRRRSRPLLDVDPRGRIAVEAGGVVERQRRLAGRRDARRARGSARGSRTDAAYPLGPDAARSWAFTSGYLVEMGAWTFSGFGSFIAAGGQPELGSVCGPDDPRSLPSPA